MTDKNPSPPFDTFADAGELQQTVADDFCKLAQECCDKNDRFTVSLSGGSTPKRLYKLLSQRALPWNLIHWFWGDERNVPRDHSSSNFRMVKHALLDHVPIPPANVHAVPVVIDHPGEAAKAYESTILRHFGTPLPAWDLVLLGMGDDAHTASLFPDTAAIEDDDRVFVENWVPKFDTFRYTLTSQGINSGAQVWFLIAGSAKRQAIKDVLGPINDPARFPAQLIQPTRWYVTADAIG